MATFEEIQKRKKPLTKSVDVLMNGVLADEIEKLEDELRSAQSASRSRFAPSIADNPLDTAALEEKIEKLKKKAQKDVVTFVFRSIGRARIEELSRKHPPKGDLKKQGAAWDPETFAPALMAESCTDPEMTVEQATILWDDPDWNQAELMTLFMGALEVNTEKPNIPLFSGVYKPTTSSD